MSETTDTPVHIPLPSDVSKRYSHWEKLFVRASNGHLVLGVLSVMSSSVAAVVSGGSPHVGQWFAGAAAVLTATLGFLKPDRAYLKYVRAWRILDVAVLKYQAGLIDRKALIDAVASGEATVSRMEDDAVHSPLPADDCACRHARKAEPDVNGVA
jgi:hypothetical protein